MGARRDELRGSFGGLICSDLGEGNVWWVVRHQLSNEP